MKMASPSFTGVLPVALRNRVCGTVTDSVWISSSQQCCIRAVIARREEFLACSTVQGLNRQSVAWRSDAKTGTKCDWTSDRSQSQLWVRTSARISEQQCYRETGSVWISSAPFCQRAFRSNSVVLRGSFLCRVEFGHAGAHGFKATVWDEIAPISRFFGSCRFVFARHHMNARW